MVAQSRPLTIVFSSSHDAADVNAFSTTIYHMAQALKAEIPDLEIVRFPRVFLHWRLVHAVLRRLPFIRPANRDYFLKFCAWRLARRFKGRRAVVVNVVDSPLAIFLSKKLPVINVSDATHALLETSYYGVYDGLSKEDAALQHRADRAAIHSLHACFSSEWAMESAVRDYGGNPEKLSVISWGCNLPALPRDRARLVADDSRCRLLFVGAQWRRKGGDVVLQIARLLHERGLPVSVDLAGVRPVDSFPEGVDVTYHGRLDKNDPVQLEQMMELYRRATFFVLPTQQDCTPMVFAEANMLGTPAVTCDTGGVSSVVRHGRNGLVLPHAAKASDYADAIEALWRDSSSYEALRRSSRTEYEERLNWETWAHEIACLVHNLDEQGKIP
jgi:glycosyltransferase involved in cell wall biosynthesis